MSELPLLLFTVLTGLSAGGFVMATVFGLVAKEKSRTWIFSFACLVLLGAGLICVLFHLGHPERFLNGLANPRAGIAQEAYFSIALGILLFIDVRLLKLRKSKGWVIPVLASVAAIGLMVVTSWAYFTSYGITPWPSIATIAQFIFGNLALGAVFALAYNVPLRVCKCIAIATAFSVLFALAIIAELIVFAAAHVQFAAFAVALLLVIALMVGELVALRGTGASPKERGESQAGILVKITGNQDRFAWILFTIALAAVIVTRFGFYVVV